MDKTNLHQVNPNNYKHLCIRPEEILRWLINENAYWIYEGPPIPNKAHAELTTGLCSDGFFDVLKILRYPNITEILGNQLACKIRTETGIWMGNVDWVVSSPYAAITLGHEVAKVFKATFLMAEKDLADLKRKKMIWSRMTIPAGARVLRIEELVTTSGTFKEVTRAVQEGNRIKPVIFIPIVGTIIHRPEKIPTEYGDIKVISLVEKEIKNYKPEECPYCKVGSPRYSPKTNWAELTGKK